MRKVVFIYLLILCLSVFSVLGGNLFVRDVYAIPNSNVPAPDGHPHTCGIVGHADFIDGTVTWENGTGNWANGNLTNPDSTCHQHRDGCDFRILSEAGPPPYPDPYVSPQPYSPCAVWDNLQVRIDDDADFDLGHGFINEFPTAGGGLACIPRYAFSGAWNNDAKQRVRDAFKEYSDVESDKKWLATGIAFVEGSPAQITIYWENLVGEGLAYTDLANGVMRFDSNPDSGNSWEFGTKADTNNTEIHFYSTALHEVGHVVGLDDQGDHTDDDDVMIWQRGPGGGNNFPNGPAFDQLDEETKHGVRDLYSIPAPDFGDAPPPYPTKKPNGARNLFIGREMLGASLIGPTTTTWEWDARAVDAPDDGCGFWLPPLGTKGTGFVLVRVSVTNRTSPRYNNAFGYELRLAIWIDWNEDQLWAHPGEMIVSDWLRPSTWILNTWFKIYSFPVPDGWSETWARARLVYANTDLNLGPSGLLPTSQSPDNGGEVEDYKLPYHEYEVEEVTHSKAVVGQGYSLDINVTVTNEGNYTETFNTAAYANTTSIASEIVTLPGNSSTTVSFVWNTAGYAKGNYTISAYAEPAPDEADTTDNTLIDGWVFITIPGDINADQRVNILDCIILANHFGHANGNSDINSDSKVNILDCIILAGHFGETTP